MNKSYETIEINFLQHKIPLAGTILYRYCQTDEILEFFVRYDFHSTKNKPVFKLTGNEALVRWEELNSNSKTVDKSIDKSVENYLFNEAYKISGLTKDDLKKKTRKGEIVFMRQLIMFGANYYFKYSFAKSGAIFGLDHSTAVHAKKTIEENTENKFSWRHEWKTRFKKSIAESAKLFNENQTKK